MKFVSLEERFSSNLSDNMLSGVAVVLKRVDPPSDKGHRSVLPVWIQELLLVLVLACEDINGGLSTYYHLWFSFKWSNLSLNTKSLSSFLVPEMKSLRITDLVKLCNIVI